MVKVISFLENGYTPDFFSVPDGTPYGLMESRTPGVIARARVSNDNVFALRESCYNAWQVNEPVYFQFLDDNDLEILAPIVAAQIAKTPDGNFLDLLVHLNANNVHFETQSDDFPDQEDDEYFLP